MDQLYMIVQVSNNAGWSIYYGKKAKALDVLNTSKDRAYAKEYPSYEKMMIQLKYFSETKENATIHNLDTSNAA